MATHSAGLSCEVFEQPLLVLPFVFLLSAGDMLLSVLEHAVDDLGELVRGGDDGLYRAAPSLYAPVEGAGGGFAAGKALGGHAQRAGRAGGDPPRGFLADAPAGDLVVRTQAQVGGEGLSLGKGLMSTPCSVMMVNAVSASMPSMRVRSTPAMCNASSARSKWHWFFRRPPRGFPCACSCAPQSRGREDAKAPVPTRPVRRSAGVTSPRGRTRTSSSRQGRRRGSRRAGWGRCRGAGCRSVSSRGCRGRAGRSRACRSA